MDQGCKVFISTFNCAKGFPFQNEEALIRVLKRLLPRAPSHDIYALGFQELLSTWEASFPLVVEPLMNYLSSMIVNYVNSLSEGRKYFLTGFTFTGAVGLVVLAENNFKVEKVTQSNYKCGLFSSSLKGSAALCFTFENTAKNRDCETYTFICSHLNANEGPDNTALRIDNYNGVIERAATDFKETSFSKGHIFFLGDLNFRVHGWHDMQTDYSNSSVLNKVLNHYEELNQLKKRGKVFTGFVEASISFPPTYKYITSQCNEFDDRRTPSWCDRILFKKYNGCFSCNAYKSIDRFPELQFSDHQAVTLDISVPSISTERPLDINVMPLSRNQQIFGSIVDTLIGYGGWLLHLKAHYAIIVVLIVFLLFKFY